jgi:hypothetical protein
MERPNCQIDSNIFQQNGTSGTCGKWNGTEQVRVKKEKNMNAKQLNQQYSIVGFLDQKDSSLLPKRVITIGISV